jgi:hypothetical protein
VSLLEVARELAEILDRLGSSAGTCQIRLQKLRIGRLLVRFLAPSRERLRDVAQRSERVDQSRYQL